MKTISKKTLSFGKIAYYGNRKENLVTLEIELKQRGGDPTFRYIDDKKVMTGETTPEYMELSICGNIWNRLQTNILCGGQCLDTIHDYIRGNKLFNEIYKLWKTYHLNGMNAGTPEQMEFISSRGLSGRDYSYVCEQLEKNGLLVVNFSGLTIGKIYDNEPYKYGTGWVVNPLPESVISRVMDICA